MVIFYGVVLKRFFTITYFLIFFLGSSYANASLSKIYIYGVVDGDSLLARKNKDNKSQKIKVRLWGIDSPEWNQPFSKESKKFMKKMVLGKYVLMESKGYDKYGRLLTIIYLEDNQTLNLLAIKEGYAWVHNYYCNENICDNWLSAQNNAKKKGIGLWQNYKPVAPWVWKNQEKKYYKRDN